MKQQRWLHLLPVCLLLVTAMAPADDIGYKGSASFTGIQIATTYWDRQQPASVGRMIAQDKPDSIHFVWTQKSTVGGSPYAQYQFLYYAYGSGWMLSLPPDGFPITSNVSSGANVATVANRAAAVFHQGTQPTARPSRLAIDYLSGMAIFAANDIPGYNCSYITTGYTENSYSWPKIAVEESTSPDPIFHVITTEGDASGGEMLSLVYLRGVGDPPSFGSCGTFIDSVLTTAAIICQDPVSNKVAIVYLRPRNKNASTASVADNDVVYVYSYDQGNTWSSKIHVTNYQNSDGERAYPDLTAMYTTQSRLHIVWVEAHFDYATNSFEPQRCKMKHWDDASVMTTTAAYADNIQSCAPGAGMLNIAKPCLSECDDKLYVTYTRFPGDPTTSTQDCSAGGYANGELHIKVSETAGYTWGPAVNISNTRTNGCTPGNCESENWPSVVEQCDDSLRIFYVGDTDAGAYADGSNEGTQTSCRMMFQSVPCFAMTLFVELIVYPDNFATIPIEVAVAEDVDTTLVISNRGNVSGYCFIYPQYLTGPSGWLNVFPSVHTIQPNRSETFDVQVIGITPGHFTANIVIQNNGGGADLIIPIAMHCADSYTPGDASGDGAVDISDAVYLIGYIFSGGPAPNPQAAGDANCDTTVDISDAVYLIAYIFSGGPAPC